MTIWIYHLSMTPEEESKLQENSRLNLPFVGLPDLSRVSNQWQAARLLAKLHPEDPPESINRRIDRFWAIYAGIHLEDIIAVPLHSTSEVLLAEVSGKYEYSVGENGEDIHQIPVKFYSERISMRTFRKHKELFTASSPKMVEVTDEGARILIRDQLPHSYNRFAKYKWLIVLFFLMSLVRVFQRVSG